MSERNNKLELLGSAPIPKALMALGVPIMIGMLINALYNLVDAYFVSGLGKSQMGAISIVFPLGQVVVGLGLMFGNGAASYLSRLLGRGDKDTANKVASTALYSSLLIGAIRALQSPTPEPVLPVSALSFGCAAVPVIEVSPPVRMPAPWHPLKSCL